MFDLSSSLEPEGLPRGMKVIERGWLSSNMVLLEGPDELVVIDTGYFAHSSQTVALVKAALDRHPFGANARVRLVNTHLHSDHCGGNAAIQAHFSQTVTLVPPASWPLVQQWLPVQRAFDLTGQHCPRFWASGPLLPASPILLGDRHWEVYSAPGHDPHSVVLFEPTSRTLISADALWRDGFGVVFPELNGESGFDEVAATLDLIESLDVKTVIPGHGTCFTDTTAALSRARSKLLFFRANPERHLSHAAKVLLSFKAMEWGHFTHSQLHQWAYSTLLMRQIHHQMTTKGFAAWIDDLYLNFVRRGHWEARDNGRFVVTEQT